MEKKIEKWLSEGLIDKQIALKMLADIKEDKQKSARIKINIAIYMVAVVLLGLGVITFISANDWILKLLESSDIVKIFLMTLITIGSFAGGYALVYEKKNFVRLGNSLIVLSSLLIGGTYALIGQIYNLNANSSFLMFLWMFSILPIAYLFRSYAINIISIILMILGFVFFYVELAIDTSLVWTIFMPIFLGITLYSIGNIPAIQKRFNAFSLSYKIVGVLPIFITLLILTCSVEHSYQITSPYYIIPIVFLMILNFINYMNDKESSLLLKIETCSIEILLGLLLLLLILSSVPTIVVMLLANLFIISMVIFGFNYGYKFENGAIIAITNWMLTIYLIVNYCRWGWSFMDKSLFFILGGILLLTLGLFLEKRRKEVVGKEN